MPYRAQENKKPSLLLLYLACGGTRKTAERRIADKKAKDKGKEKQRPSKKTTYADFSVPGGRLVRSIRKPERERGQYELKKTSRVLGW